MNPPTTRSSVNNNTSLPGTSRTTADLALPLAAVISLAIASYVVVVLVVIALQKWLTRFCCSTTSEPETNCDICFGEINCCSLMNCCNAGWLPKLPCSTFCHETSQPIDCQSCDCLCFEIAFHLKSRGPGRPNDTISS